MPDIELIGILKIMCEVVYGWQVGRRFNSQVMWPNSIINCKYTQWKITGQIAWTLTRIMQTCYIISGPVQTWRQMKKLADQCSKFTANLVMFYRNLMVWGHILTEDERGQQPIPGLTQEGGICTGVATQRGDRQVAETVGNWAIGCGWEIRMVEQLCPSPKG